MMASLKRPLEGYNRTWLGTIAVTLIVIALLAGLGVTRLGLGERKFRAEFAQAASLRSGDQVTVAGIPVGNVKALQRAGDRIIVTFKVRNDVHLGAQTRAAIKLRTLLGNRYLELAPASGGALDHMIDISHTSVPYDLQATLADATRTFEQVDAERVAASMTTLAHGLNGVPEALPRTLDNLKSLAAIVSHRRDQIGSLLTSVDTVSSMMHRQQADLGALVVQGRRLLAEIVTRRAAVEQLFASVTALVHKISEILNDAPGINKLFADINDFSRMVAGNDALLRNILQALPLPFRNLANASGSGMSIDVTLPSGLMVDSWMCAISGRAQQFNLTEYFKDCK